MTDAQQLFCLRKGNIYALPIVHYNMETAAQVHIAFQRLQPDCVAVELAETMELQLLHAASRLPDISVVVSEDASGTPLYYLCEPCDGAFEALRCALDSKRPAHCIDLDVDFYPEMRELMPDAYAIHRIGLQRYYEAYKAHVLDKHPARSHLDDKREMHMARRLKELSLQHDSVLFVGGMLHVQRVLDLTEQNTFPTSDHARRDRIALCTLSEESCREVLGEFGYVSTRFEALREEHGQSDPDLAFAGLAKQVDFPPDRQALLYQLLRDAGAAYQEATGDRFQGYHLRNTMKFMRNYALLQGALMPDLYQLLTSAKGCVNHNYAYEVWKLATEYPHLRNIDNLPVLDLKIDDIWGKSKIVRFHMTEQNRKTWGFRNRLKKDHSKVRFQPPGPFTICSYPPEDLIVENFGDFLKKKGTQLLTEEAARTVPFSTSLEDGIDTRETIRHWAEHKLYVKMSGRPPGAVGSVVCIFDEDKQEDEKEQNYEERYPWRTTWLGEHAQESDMAFYATDRLQKIVGPGICRCEYGGLMMSYPPRRMYDVWSDPDYVYCRSKSEVLLMAAIDYAVHPLIVYVAAKPPRTWFKSYARRFGKKLVYIPIGQLSSITLNKIRVFHVLDSHDKRDIADEYIF
ncbi:MAG: hypothetical protein KDK78_04115 [Chlamydiia bacterium]|nr:hypothetical protein [Chlamydiia bacterium]